MKNFVMSFGKIALDLGMYLVIIGLIVTGIAAIFSWNFIILLYCFIAFIAVCLSTFTIYLLIDIRDQLTLLTNNSIPEPVKTKNIPKDTPSSDYEGKETSLGIVIMSFFIFIFIIFVLFLFSNAGH